MNYNVKQVIVVRDDLKMRKGKFAAQVAHASMKVFFDRDVGAMVGLVPRVPVTIQPSADCEVDHVHLYSDVPQLVVFLDPVMADWVRGVFAKVVLLVDDEAALLEVLRLATEAGLPCAMIEDLGFTEFHGQVTKTAVAVGPARVEDIDVITGPGGKVKTRLA